jgi:hypothetical protein
MSTNSSHVGVTLFLSFQHNFYHFTFTGFPFTLVRLMDVNTGRLSGMKYKLVCCFKLAVDMVGVASGSLCMTWMDHVKVFIRN